MLNSPASFASSRSPFGITGCRVRKTWATGEAEAIQLAKEIGADILLTDDRKARAAAVSLDVRCSGLLDLLVLAKRANHLESVRAMIQILEKQGGLYLSPAVKVEALKIAGEQQF